LLTVSGGADIELIPNRLTFVTRISSLLTVLVLLEGVQGRMGGVSRSTDKVLSTERGVEGGDCLQSLCCRPAFFRAMAALKRASCVATSLSTSLLLLLFVCAMALAVVGLMVILLLSSRLSTQLGDRAIVVFVTISLLDAVFRLFWDCQKLGPHLVLDCSGVAIVKGAFDFLLVDNGDSGGEIGEGAFLMGFPRLVLVLFFPLPLLLLWWWWPLLSPAEEKMVWIW